MKNRLNVPSCTNCSRTEAASSAKAMSCLSHVRLGLESPEAWFATYSRLRSKESDSIRIHGHGIE